MKALDELERIASLSGHAMAQRKLVLLDSLRDLKSARAVSRLHEILLILRAYPDDEEVLARVDGMLDAFGRRADLARFRDQLADSGIAGTRIYYRFYAGMAAWLCRRWPAQLHIDWEEVHNGPQIERVLQLLLLHAETPALDTMIRDTEEWLACFKSPEQTDAAFLIERMGTLPAGARELVYDMLDVPLCLEPGDDTPSRTRALHRWRPVDYRTRPEKGPRPDLARAARVPPLHIEEASLDDGERLVDLAREAMLTRHRDLDGIDWADAHSVQRIDAGDGLSFAAMGLRPLRRLMFEGVFVFLILQNGVPIGYFQAAVLFGAAEINYNLFPPWRGAGAADIYARGIAMVHHWLGADTFVVDPYQLGQDNPEALASGAFWFYYKLGFRPEDAERQAIVARELRAMKKHAAHRSSRATLRALMHDYLFFYLDGRRDDVVGKLSYGEAALRVTRYVAERYGADREAAMLGCAAEAGRLLACDPIDFDEHELGAWYRWSPLVMLLGAEDWPDGDKRDLVAVIRAKGGPSERDYVLRFAAHARLRAALARLATPP